MSKRRAETEGDYVCDGVHYGPGITGSTGEPPDITYYEHNKKHIRNQQKQYYKDNKEDIKENTRKRYYKNREKILQKRREKYRRTGR